jgi:Cys-tRNA(Pro)/Cys-tRNA(Cys) deacylase
VSAPGIHARVAQHVESFGVSCTVRHHADFLADIRSPADFADALGYQVGRVTKSVFCRSQSKAHYAVLVAPSDARIDLKRAARRLDAGRLEIASPNELGEITGYPRHGVSPFGLDPAVSVVVARELLGFDSVLVGAGTVGVELEVSPADLVAATEAVVEALVKRP